MESTTPTYFLRTLEMILNMKEISIAGIIAIWNNFLLYGHIETDNMQSPSRQC